MTSPWPGHAGGRLARSRRREGPPRWGYASLWRGACAITAALGTCVGLLIWPPVVSLVLFAVATSFAWLVLATCFASEEEKARVLDPGVLGRCGLAGLTAVAVPAWGQLDGRLVLTLFSLAGLTAPPSVAWLMSRSKILRPPPDPESAVRLSSWAATTTLLSGALTPREALATIQRRQTMLDELELLDPQAFQEWLATLVERLGPVDLSSAVDPQRRDAA